MYAVDEFGATPLMLAVSVGEVAVVRWLLSQSVTSFVGIRCCSFCFRMLSSVESMVFVDSHLHNALAACSTESFEHDQWVELCFVSKC